MAAKLLVFSVLVATACGSGGFSSFSYDVSDPRTGDVKGQHEKREGGHVVGQYSLLEADGTKRVVEYQADDASGFKAIVHKEPARGLAGAHGARFAGAGLGHGTGAPLASGHLPHTAHAAGAHANSVYPGYAPYAAGFSNPGARPIGAQGAPAVSSYSYNVVHDASRPYTGPYAGAYGGYGAQGALAGRLGHGVGANGWASSVENVGNGWSSPLANGANGWSSSPFATGANGWAPGGATNGWPSSLNAGSDSWSANQARGASGWPSTGATGFNVWPSSYAKGANDWSSPIGGPGHSASPAW